MRILILGGTADAVTLADRLSRLGHKVITSLAGRTSHPVRPRGQLREGGFGGVDGLVDYLGRQRIELLIDATHPFATTISANAVKASRQAEVPLVRLERPGFVEPAGAHWQRVKTLEDAAKALPTGATVLVTTGRQSLQPFLDRPDCRYIVRAIEPPAEPLPLNFVLILARPPFSEKDELTLMQRRGVTHLITKDSGGDATSAKLQAAFVLKVQTILVERPELPPALHFAGVDEIVAHISQLPEAAPRARFLPLLRRIWEKSGA